VNSSMAHRLFTAEEEYPDLENHHSHMAHCLTETVYKQLRGVETDSGFTIDDVIQLGVDNPGEPYLMPAGCIAGDEESYRAFSAFFDQVLEARHNGFKKNDVSRNNTMSENVKGGDFDGKYALTSYVTSRRNVKGFALPGHFTRGERRKVEAIAKSALSGCDGEFGGQYFSIKGSSDKDLEQLAVVFKQPISATSQPTIFARDWPDSRGFWYNAKKNFLVKVNEEDHLSVLSTETGGNLVPSFRRWVEGVAAIENGVKKSGNEFMHDERYGYIATCPTNVGTSLKVGVVLKIPKMMKYCRLEEALMRLRLEKIDLGDCVDVSNIDRIGLTEVEILELVIEGVQFLIDCEERLEKGQKIEKYVNILRQK
uniref:creatine kinase n=2 Tax=Ciona intestinalis TaxID=7719 RepID=F6YFT9_CIOIN